MSKMKKMLAKNPDWIIYFLPISCFMEIKDEDYCPSEDEKDIPTLAYLIAEQSFAPSPIIHTTSPSS